MRSEEDVRADVHALWAAVFGEPPVVEASMDDLIAVLVASLPTVSYDMIWNPGAAPPAPGRDAPTSVRTGNVEGFVGVGFAEGGAPAVHVLAGLVVDAAVLRP